MEQDDRKRDEDDDAKLLCEENIFKRSQANANPALSTIPPIPVSDFVRFAQGIAPPSSYPRSASTNSCVASLFSFSLSASQPLSHINRLSP